MKFIVASSVVAVLLMVCSPIQGAKICVSHVETCNDNVPVCGRFGGSNLCKNFKNRCEFEIFNCASTTPYKIVNGDMCEGIAVNTRTFCTGLQTGPVGGGKFPNWGGNNHGAGGKFPNWGGNKHGAGGKFPNWGGNKHGAAGCPNGKKCGLGNGGVIKGGLNGGYDIQPIVINTGK